MSDAENQPEMSGDPLVDELENEVQALRTLLSVSLIVLLVFAICMNAFLGMQITQLKTQHDQAQQGAIMMRNQAEEIWRKMVDFSRTNTDFAPYTEKYRSFFTNQSTAAAPKASAPAAAPKK